MFSRYDHMRESKVQDIDGEKFPDPLTIDYQTPIDNLRSMPGSYTFKASDLKKLWVTYYKQTQRLDGDDILYSMNGVEHVGVLEPEDVIYLFPVDEVEQYHFKDLQ